MRLLLAVSLAALTQVSIAPSARAQAGYEAGRSVISVSLGAGVSGLYGTTDMPLLAVSAEFGVSDEISVGGVLGVSSSTYEYGYPGDAALTVGYTIVAARSSYHLGGFFDIEKLDLYAGGSLGYNRVSLKSQSGGASTGEAFGSYILYGAHLGGRYFFTPALAGFAEVGHGLGNVAAGVSLRF